MKKVAQILQVLLIVTVLGLILYSYYLNRRLKEISREQEEIRLNLLQEFGPCWQIPAGQCRE